MDAEQAISAVKSRHPHIKAGRWSAGQNGADWQVLHRYAGRRAPTVEVYVCPDGSMEDVDGNKV